MSGIDELPELVSTSHVGLVIFTENYRKDTKALLELAVIIIEDKPMNLLVKRGTYPLREAQVHRGRRGVLRRKEGLRHRCRPAGWPNEGTDGA